MNNTPQENALLELEKLREDLIAVVNRNVDALKERILNGDDSDNSNSELIYPLTATASFFKGMKPTAVIFGEERIAVKTWRETYTLILRWCDDDKHDALMELRNRISGRSRTFLTDKPDGMDFPIKINESLYAEGDFDTEYLIIIMRQIMDAAHYDHGNISVAVVQGKRGRQ